MYRIIISLFSSLRLYYLRCVYFFRDRAFIKMYNLPKLSKNEMSIVKQTWPCLSLKRFDLIYLRMYKKEYGFDPYFICDYQMQQILKKRIYRFEFLHWKIKECLIFILINYHCLKFLCVVFQMCSIIN